MRDFYSRKARKEGYLARSAYKLKQLAAKYRLFKAGDVVIDLGCSPGGWVKVTLERIGPSGTVYGVDLAPPRLRDPRFHFLRGNLMDKDVRDRLPARCDVLLSDLAPKTTGIQELDKERSLGLAEDALTLAQQRLKARGHFLCKIFQGPGFQAFFVTVKSQFQFVKTVKPEASKKQSKEVYVLGLCKRTSPHSETP